MVRTAGFVARPVRPEPVTGRIQGTELLQYDLTPEQYQALDQTHRRVVQDLSEIEM